MLNPAAGLSHLHSAPAPPPVLQCSLWNPSSSRAKLFSPRLIVGTGKYKHGQETQAAHRSLRRRDGHRRRPPRQSRPLQGIPARLHRSASRYFLLPNTAGCYTADEAIRAARLGREVGLSDWVKIEVIGDQATLYPDVAGHARSHPHTRQGRLHRPPLHLRRHRLRASPHRRGSRRRHASRRAHRLRAGHPEPRHHPHPPRK